MGPVTIYLIRPKQTFVQNYAKYNITISSILYTLITISIIGSKVTLDTQTTTGITNIALVDYVRFGFSVHISAIPPPSWSNQGSATLRWSLKTETKTATIVSLISKSKLRPRLSLPCQIKSNLDSMDCFSKGIVDLNNFA